MGHGNRWEFDCMRILCMSQMLIALKRGQNALLEAPTGCGKTLSLLCAALAWQDAQRAEIAAQQLQVPCPQCTGSGAKAFVSACVDACGLGPQVPVWLEAWELHRTIQCTGCAGGGEAAIKCARWSGGRA
jgi:hypothetical protein